MMMRNDIETAVHKKCPKICKYFKLVNRMKNLKKKVKIIVTKNECHLIWF